MAARQPKTYDCYVTLARVQRQGRLVPGAGPTPVAAVDDWRSLVHSGTLAVYLVERTNTTNAKDLLLAHLAGFAPSGVTRLWRRPDEPVQVASDGADGADR